MNAVEGWIEYEDTGVGEVGIVARPRISVSFEGAQGRVRKKTLDIGTQSDSVIIPQSFAVTVGLTSGKPAAANGERGDLTTGKLTIGEKTMRTIVFCSEGEASLLGMKVIQEFSKLEFDFRQRIVRFT